MMESLKSWIRVDPRCDFTLYNIPFGVFSTKSDPESKRRCCSAIGDYIIDLVALYENKLLIESDHGNVFNKPSLNSFMELNKTFWSNTRIQIIKLLLEESYRDIDGICIPDRRLRDNEELKRLTLLPLSSVNLHLPVDISDYTDFYSSREHAENVGSIFRGKNSVTGNCLQPNWLHLPVGYHGRSSTVVVSNTDVTRPCGQVLMEDGTPQLVPCRSLDFELELGYLIGGTPNKLGEVRKLYSFFAIN
jgi:fumarylacetoacetase